MAASEEKNSKNWAVIDASAFVKLIIKEGEDGKDGQKLLSYIQDQQLNVYCVYPILNIEVLSVIYRTARNNFHIVDKQKQTDLWVGKIKANLDPLGKVVVQDDFLKIISKIFLAVGIKTELTTMDAAYIGGFAVLEENLKSDGHFISFDRAQRAVAHSFGAKKFYPAWESFGGEKK